MARSSSTSRPFLHRRSDTGQFSYVRELQNGIGPLVVGYVQRLWLGTPFLLAGKDVIKISLKTGDAETAKQRWFDVHTQVEPLVQGAVVQARQKSHRTSSTANLTMVATLSEDQRQVLAEQKRHDILADDDASWIDADYLNRTAVAVHRAAQGHLSIQQAGNEARQIEARIVNHALKTRDTGILETSIMEIDDSAQAKTLLDLMLATATSGNVPDQGDIAKLSQLAKTSVRDGELDERLSENGIRMPANSVERRTAALSMLRAAAQAYHEIDDRMIGRNIVTLPRPSPLVLPQPAAEQSSPRMSDVFDMWVRLKRPSAKTKGHNCLYMQRFIAVHGDLPVANVTREQIRAFRDLIERFPRNVPPALEGATPHDIAAWAQANPHVPRISRTTVNNRAIGALSTLFDTALREALVDSNPCNRLRLPLKASDRKQVAPFSIAELNVIFAAPEIRGTARHARAGGGEAARWLPLIGLFTGARMEEIAQLHVADIVKMDDFYAFRMTTDTEDAPSTTRNSAISEDKSLKNASAHRLVPIHDTLITSGFLDYLNKRRKAGDRRLFPLVTATGDRCAKNWSRWFARFLDKHVSSSISKNFHSFRHTFIDGMRDSLVGRDVIKAIVGHANADVTDGYGHGCSPRTMHAELKKLEYRGLILG